MEDRERIDAYLSRLLIGADHGLGPTIESLRLLQKRHLLNVPFENLDIHWKRPIVLEPKRLFEKIIIDRHGGFCYELNGVFNELLRDLGFQTRLVSARVFGGERGFGPEFDHAAIIVTVGRSEYLADVGFGDFAAEPLQLFTDIEQHDREGVFMIRRNPDGAFEVARMVSGSWVPEYRFDPLGRDLSEFAEMCDFQQFSAESHFTKGKVCSILTDGGRKTLTDTKYIVTRNGEKTEEQVASDDRFDEILMREFRIARPVQHL